MKRLYSSVPGTDEVRMAWVGCWKMTRPGHCFGANRLRRPRTED